MIKRKLVSFKTRVTMEIYRNCLYNFMSKIIIKNIKLICIKPLNTLQPWQIYLFFIQMATNGCRLFLMVSFVNLSGFLRWYKLLCGFTLNTNKQTNLFFPSNPFCSELLSLCESVLRIFSVGVFAAVISLNFVNTTEPLMVSIVIIECCLAKHSLNQQDLFFSSRCQTDF